MEILGGIMFLAIIIGIAWLWNTAENAFNRHVLSRGEYQAEQELTNQKFRYPCHANGSIIRPMLDNSPLGSSLEISTDTPDGVIFLYRPLLTPEFYACLEYPASGNGTATFEFLKWTESNGVATHTSEMKTLKAWVEDVLLQADRAAIRQ